MTSIIRRGGSQILKLIESGADPALIADAVQLYAKDDGGTAQLFAEDGAGTIYQLTPPSGSTSVAPTIWDIPAVPNVDDEDFNTGSTLPAAFAINQGSIGATAIDAYAGFAVGDARINVNTQRPSWVIFQPVASGGVDILTVTKAITVAGDFAMWFRGDFNHRAGVAAINNDFSLSMILTTNPFDVNNNLSLFINEADAGIVQMEFSKTVGGVITSIGTTANMPVNEHWAFQGGVIQVIGGNAHAWALTDRSSVYLGTSAFAPVIGRAGFRMYNASNANPGNMFLYADFLRKVDGIYQLP